MAEPTQTKEVYENLLLSLPDPFFVIREDGTYVEAFGSIERSLYDDNSKLKGKNIYECMPKEFADYFMSQVHRTLNGTGLTVFEYQLETERVLGIPKEGPPGTQWFEARLYPLDTLYDGQRAVTALVLQISDRKTIQHRLRELSYQDPVTKVANRRFFFKMLAQQLDLFRNSYTPLSLLLIDIDHFKLINDTHGHLCGDAILQSVVNTIGEVIGEGNLLARFGGDEFVVYIKGKSTQDVKELGETIRQKVEQNITRCDNIPVAATVSVGLTHVNSFDADVESIFKRVDIALYRAKHQGRNKVVEF